jgi:uncharacterized protein
MSLSVDRPVSIVIPVYADADALRRTLASIESSDAEIVVVGTAGDRSLDALRTDRPDITWVEAPRGRARQMNAGAACARGAALVFLHADTRLPSGWAIEVDRALRDPAIALGCFRFALDSASIPARVIEVGVRLRVALARLPYGDQALFVRRQTFDAIGGYADVPIMEDVLFVKRARRFGHLYISTLPAVTSARGWERDGWVRRTAVHLRLIVLFIAGVPPERLNRMDRTRTSL